MYLDYKLSELYIWTIDLAYYVLGLCVWFVGLACVFWTMNLAFLNYISYLFLDIRFSILCVLGLCFSNEVWTSFYVYCVYLFVNCF